MVILKLQLGQEIRRYGEAPASLQEIQDRVLQLFKISSTMFEYDDIDNDPVKFDSQEEYEEALRCHKRPFRLRIIDRKNNFSANCSKLQTEIGQEIRICDSFGDSLLEHGDEEANKDQNLKMEKKKEFESKMSQTDDLEFCDKEVQGMELSRAKDVQCQVSRSNEELIENLRRIVLDKKPKVDLGVRCYSCKDQLYDTLFKCSKCSYYYICKNCLELNSHHHQLIKSNMPVTNKVYCANIYELTEKLKSMGFEDEVQNLTALISSDYDLEKAINIISP